MYNKLSKAVPVAVTLRDLNKTLMELQNWKVIDKTLTREIVFRDYESTWAFLTQLSMRSHLWGHHPTITTTYNKVKLELSTHDLEEQVSDIDLKMAKRIEKYVKMYNYEQSE